MHTAGIPRGLVCCENLEDLGDGGILTPVVLQCGAFCETAPVVVGQMRLKQSDAGVTASRVKASAPDLGLDYMAEGEGFEPPVPFRVQRFSRPPVSTAHTSLRVAILRNCTTGQRAALATS